MKSAIFAVTLLSFVLPSIGHSQPGQLGLVGVHDYLHRGDDQFQLGNIEAAIANYSLAIKTSPSNAVLYCKRGIARQDLGDTKNALTDCDTAIQVSLQRWAPAFGIRADIEISLGNYDAAIADLNRAITIDPRYSRGYELQGSIKEFKGDLAGAVTDYAEASRLDIHHAYPQIFIWIARTREGQNVVANQEFAAYLDRHVETSAGHWATKAGEFLLGRISESELIAAASSYFVRTAHGHQCEAWFYAGLKHLLSGDKAIAADDFRKCLATNARSYDEYYRAVIELKKLGKA